MWQGIRGSNICKQLLLQVGVEESKCLIDSLGTDHFCLYSDLVWKSLLFLVVAAFG
jgi:hypothetical protein